MSACTKRVRDFPQTKLDREINSPFALKTFCLSGNQDLTLYEGDSNF